MFDKRKERKWLFPLCYVWFVKNIKKRRKKIPIFGFSITNMEKDKYNQN